MFKIFFLFFVSFFLDGIIPQLINSFAGSAVFLLPFFTVTFLIYLAVILNKEPYELLILSFIFGLFYDVAYTNVLFLNSFIFIIISVLLLLFYRQIKTNVLINIIVTILTILIYISLNYLVFQILGVASFSLENIFYIFIRSIPINITYISLLTLLLKNRNQKVSFSNYLRFYS